MDMFQVMFSSPGSIQIYFYSNIGNNISAIADFNKLFTVASSNICLYYKK
jgi:large exoprotein involved in heme utilization and adhesion